MSLAVFTLAIGNNSGKNSFRSLKHAAQLIAAVVGVLIVAAICTFPVGRYVFAVDSGIIAGTFVGGITNTPALAAVGEMSGQKSLATVGHAVSYLFGVLDMIAVAQLVLRKAPGDTDMPDPVTHYNVRIEHDDRSTIEQVGAELDSPAEISRMRRGEKGSIWIPDNDEVLEKSDLVTVVGTIENVSNMLKHLGCRSSHSPHLDRRMFDSRHIMVFKHSHAGKTVAGFDRELKERWDAKISRVRRGDVDMLAMSSFMVGLGDRVHVVGPILELKEISRWLGSSSKGPGDINPMTLGLGPTLGYFIGKIELPIPGGGHLTLGYAAGILTVGLIVGRVGRIGPFITALPSTSNVVLAGLGLFMFLARVRTNAGAQILEAFSGGYWWKIFILGFTTTAVVAALLYIVMRGMFKMGRTKLPGLLGGAQIQPAVLAFADGRTGTDLRIAPGYALVYPVAVIVKILLAHILGTL